MNYYSNMTVKFVQSYMPITGNVACQYVYSFLGPMVDAGDIIYGHVCK